MENQINIMEKSWKYHGILLKKKPFFIYVCYILLLGLCFGESDEIIRLTTDSGKDYEGMVEIFYDNQWGSINPSAINDETASVICRHLGLGDAGFEVEYYYVSKRVRRTFSYLYCDGDETDIFDCRFSRFSSLFYYTSGSGVMCKEFNSSSLRLHGGNNVSEGKLQFYFNGKWKGLCEEQIDYDVYHIGCKEIGYKIVKSFSQSTTFDATQGILPFKFSCSTTSSHFDACSIRIDSAKNCTDSGRIIVKCDTFKITNIRLVNGNSSSEGRVEMFDGQWKTICNKGMGATVADIICKETGWRTALKYGQYEGDGSGTIIPYHFYCNSYDTNIDDCEIVNRNYSCTHENDVFLTCSDFQVNGVRLVNGSNNAEGRIELLLDGKWRTVCDRTSRTGTYDVICRMLGYRNAKHVYTDAYFGEGEGDILTNWIYCSTTDIDLTSCNVRYSGYTCSHSDDISLQCTDFNITDTRLVNGSGPDEGRIELNIDGEWMTVCDSIFRSGYAMDTICREHGYKGVIDVFYNAYFGQGSGDITTHIFTCSTKTSSLSSCSVRYSGSSSCRTHSDDLSMKCSNLEIQDIRLADGHFSNEGRVEIFIDGEWRTVCDSYWYSNDVEVLCRSLGFVGREDSYSNAYFGQGTGKILSNDFSCSGRELHLRNCSVFHRGYLCSHSDDFSIRCTACGSLPIPKNGNKILSGTSHGDFARFDCKPGYFLLGSALRVCQVNNTWNGTEAKCVKECEQLLAPLNGSVTSTIDEQFQTTVTFACDPGFDLIGMENRSCMENGEWNGSNPTCKIKNCGTFDAPINGLVDFSRGTTFKSLAVVACDTGFTLYGYRSRECIHDGTWAGINPKCSDLEIQDVRLANGGVQNEGRVEMKVNDVWKSICGSYWSVNDVDVLCRSLGFTKMEARYQNNHFGEGTGMYLSTDFACDGTEAHFRNCSLENEDNDCTQSEDLSIKCVACTTLPIPRNGRQTSSGTFYGDFARFECENGFGLIGSSIRVCQSDNTWNGTEAECIRDCGTLSAPVNGSVFLPINTLITSIVTFKCDPGFELVGHSNRTCQDDGMWSGSNPVCTKKDCGRFDAPQNGSVDFGSGTRYTDIGLIICDPGYFLYGDNRRVCGQNGTWTGSNPVCVELSRFGNMQDLSEPESNELDKGFVYGGIAAALIFGSVIGIVISVCIIRKRLHSKLASEREQAPFDYPNRAFENAEYPQSGHINSSDNYDSLAEFNTNNWESEGRYMTMETVRPKRPEQRP